MSTPEKQKPRLLKASPLGRGGIAQAMTERASPSPESRHAAISRFFGRAMLSLRLLFSVSVLALSVTFGDTARVAAPSVCFAVACILLAAAPTAPPCFRRWRRSSPLLPKGEPKSVRTSPFTQETGRFAQVFLIFFRRCGTFRTVKCSLFLPFLFTIQRRFLYAVLS